MAASRRVAGAAREMLRGGDSHTAGSCQSLSHPLCAPTCVTQLGLALRLKARSHACAPVPYCLPSILSADDVFLCPGSQFLSVASFPCHCRTVIWGVQAVLVREVFPHQQLRDGLQGSADDRQSLRTLRLGGIGLPAATSAWIWPKLTSAAGRITGTSSCEVSICLAELLIFLPLS